MVASDDTLGWPFDEAEDEAPARPNVVEYSVSEISFALKRTVEDTFGYVRIRGELGRVSRPASGHVYLDLKDEKAVLSGVVWKGVAQRLKVQPEQGLEVIITGKITTFPGQSKYQVVIDSMEPAGAGALMALLEERRKKLAAEGLFDEERKKELPYLPEVIGVVTSPSGAVIRDILHRLADRFPRHVVVWPVRVQGETSGDEVARAIRGFNALEVDGPIARPDVIIVARGGGSLEDLWGFNEEAVVRAAADSAIPIISAVGHETDWTLVDHAADHRAPTPTGAAERVVPVRMELAATVDDYSARLQRGLARALSDRKQALRAASRGLPKLDEALSLPRQRLDAAAGRLGQALRTSTQAQHSRYAATAARLTRRPLEQGLAQKSDTVDALFERSVRAFKRTTEIRRQSLDTQSKLLASLGYQSVLERGFALVRDGNGKPIRTAKAAKPEQRAEIQFQDGRLAATLHGTLSDKAPRPPGPKKKQGPEEGQGSLF